MQAKTLTIAEICETVGVSQATLYRYVSPEGALRGPYAENNGGSGRHETESNG